MNRPIRLRRRRLAIVSAALAACLLLGLDSQAYAGTTYCRTDPVVTMSNGDVVTMYADTGVSNVNEIRNVSYVLHGPKDVTPVSVHYDHYGYLESFEYIGDQNPGRNTNLNLYKTDTTVTTNKHGVKVTVHANIQNASCNRDSGSSSGASYEELPVNFNC